MIELFTKWAVRTSNPVTQTEKKGQQNNDSNIRLVTHVTAVTPKNKERENILMGGGNAENNSCFPKNRVTWVTKVTTPKSLVKKCNPDTSARVTEVADKAPTINRHGTRNAPLAEGLCQPEDYPLPIDLTDAETLEAYSWPEPWQRIYCILLETYDHAHAPGLARVLAYRQTKSAMAITDTRH